MAQGSPRASRRRSTTSAFLNIPYDAKYEDLYLAFIAGLCGFGLTPRATLEIPGSQRRLDRILGLIRRCRYSFHDLSRVEIDRKPPPTPRFNMPFELGLVVALTKARGRRHDWFVFESVRRRLNKSLSDLDGTEQYIHGAERRRLFRELTNALVRGRHQPTVGQLQQIYDDLKKAVPRLRRELWGATLFEARPFRDLVVAATRSAETRIASLRGGRSGRRRASSAG